MKVGRARLSEDVPEKPSSKHCLAEYADYGYKRHDLFRTVGVDHTFYGPLTPKMLEHYAAQLPSGCEACAKVREDITVPVCPSGLRYAKKTGLNRHFLDATYFDDVVLAPFG